MKVIMKALVLCALVLFSACNKNEKQITSKAAEEAISEQGKDDIIAYLKSKRDKTDKLGVSGIDTVISKINWSNFRKVVNRDQLELTVFELNSTGSPRLFLLLYAKQGAGGYVDAQLSLVKADGSGSNEIDFVCNYFLQKTEKCSGTISFLRISREFIYEKTFQNGELLKTKSLEARPKNEISKNALLPEEQTCYAIILITYWNDGSITYDIIGEYCVSNSINCQQRTTLSLMFDNNTLQTAARCGTGGGSSGGNNNNNNDNCASLPTAAEVLNGFYSTSETNSTSVGAAFINPKNSQQERHITHSWTFGRGNTSLGFFYCTSTERATQRKNAAGQWEYVSITHVNHGVTNSIPFITAEITGFSAIGMVLDPTRVRMDLYYNMKVSVVCNGSTLYTQTKSDMSASVLF